MNRIEEHKDVQEDGTLYFRDVVHIQYENFRRNQLIKTIIIGSNVQTIGKYAFAGCRNVEEILFDEPCQITKLEVGCFYECFNLRKIDLPVSIQEICSYSFLDCPFETVILRGLCRIGEGCFRVNSLTYLYITDSTQELNENAFYQYPYSPFSRAPCKIYICPEFHDEIKRMFQGHEVEFIGNELEEGYVLK